MIDMERFIDALVNAIGDQKKLVESLIERILRYPKEASFQRKNYKRNLETLSLEELKRIRSISIFTRVLVQTLHDRQYKKNKISTEQLITFIIDSQDVLAKKIRKEEAIVCRSGMIASISQKFFGKNERNEIIEGIISQILDQEMMDIVFMTIEVMKNHREKREHVTEPPVVSKYVEEQDKANAEAVSNFMEQLNAIKGPEKTVILPSFDTEAREKELLVLETQRKAREEQRHQQELCEVAARAQQQDRFQRELNHRKIDNADQEKLRKEQNIENFHKSQLEFQEKLHKKNIEYEENLKRIQEEVREFERESQRLHEERRQKWQACMNTFYACTYMKQLFEHKEKEWAGWLQSLKDSLISAKNRFRFFEKIVRSLSKSEESYNRIVEEELFSLHKSTLTTYYTLFDACETVRNLQERFPDGSFLNILHRKLVNVSNKLCGAVEAIDKCMGYPAAMSLVQDSFESLKPSEIPTTDDLRSETKNPADVKKFEDPRVYNSSSGVVIEEIDEDEIGPAYSPMESTF